MYRFIAEMTLSAIKGNARPVNVVQIVVFAVLCFELN